MATGHWSRMHRKKIPLNPPLKKGEVLRFYHALSGPF